MYSFIRMNTLYLKTNEADVINANKTEFTYFLKHPIILNEDYILHVDNYCYNGGGVKTGIATFQVQSNGNYSFNETLFNNVGQSYNIDLSLHNANVTGIVKIKLIKPPGFSAYMIAEDIIDRGNNFNANQVITLTTSLLPFYKDPASVPLKIEILTVETYNTLNKINIKLDNVKYINTLYYNNDNTFIPSLLDINFNELSVKHNNPVITLPPQIINNLKLIFKNDTGGGLGNGDILSLCLIIKKKSNNLLDKDV